MAENSRPSSRGGSDRHGNGKRPDRPARPDPGGRPERGDRPGRPARSDRGDRPQGAGRPRRDGDSRPRRDGDERPRRTGESRPERSDRTARPERGARPERSDRTGRPERSDRGPRPERSDRGPRPERSDRGGRPDRGARPDRGDRPSRGPREENPERIDRYARDYDGPDERVNRRVRPEHEDPPIAEGVTAGQLDKVTFNELKTLTQENAEFVGEHMVMAALLIDSDPELAHQHAISASRRGGRLATVRETLAITAYEIGDYALSLRELRTYRRLSGSNEQIALMVDCERGLGRPDKALELGQSVKRAELSDTAVSALAIAMSGARLDMNQPQLALAELEIPQLNKSTAFSYSPALFRAYAEVLGELGREADAKEWSKAADVAEKALIEANVLPNPDDELEDDVIVFEEGGDEADEKEASADSA